MFKYLFPKNKRASENTMHQQVNKVREEYLEVQFAYYDLESDERILEEVWDLIYAAEGILRKYPDHKVEQAYNFVKDKAKQRKDID